MNAYIIFQAFVFLLALIFLVILLHEIKIKHIRPAPMVPLLFWIVHLIVFYGFILFDNFYNTAMLTNVFFNIWSTVQRLHGIITMAYMTYLVILYEDKPNEPQS